MILRFALLLLAAGVVHADMPRYECRTKTVSPGERCWVWFPKPSRLYSGNGQPVCLGVPTGWKTEYPAKYNNNQPWARERGFCITVAPDAAPGTYTVPLLQTIPGTISPIDPPVNATDASPLTITVVASPAERPWKVACSGASAADVQSLYNQGFNVELLPGMYRWSQPISMPSNSACRSAGALIVRLNDESYRDCIFTGGTSFTLEGLTFEHDRSCGSTFGMVIHYWGATGRDTTPLAPNVTIRRCTLRGSALGRSTDHNVLIEDCLFERAGTDILPENFVMTGCRFVGSGLAGEHATLLWSCPRGALFASNSWEGTARGIVAQVGSGEGLVALDSKMSGMHGLENNSGECVLIESEWGWTNCTFCDTFIYDCNGPGFYLAGSLIEDILVYGLDSHVEKNSVMIQAVKADGSAAEIKNIEFLNVESSSKWLITGPVKNLKLTNCQWLDRGPDGHGNDSGPFPQNPFTVNSVGMWPVFTDQVAFGFSNTHVLQNCATIGRDTNYREVSSIRPWQVETTSDAPVLLEKIPLFWHPNTAVDPFIGKHQYVVQLETSALRLDSGNYETASYVKRFLVRHNRLMSTTPSAIIKGVQEIYSYEDDPSWDLHVTAGWDGVYVYAKGAVGQRILWHNTKLSVLRVPGPSYPE